MGGVPAQSGLQKHLKSGGCIYYRCLTREWASPLGVQCLGLAATETGVNNNFHFTAEVAKINLLPRDIWIQQASEPSEGISTNVSVFGFVIFSLFLLCKIL